MKKKKEIENKTLKIILNFKSDFSHCSVQYEKRILILKLHLKVLLNYYYNFLFFKKLTLSVTLRLT